MWRFSLLVGCLLWSAPARADVAPLPSRPADWDVPEPPLPDPPPEKSPLVPTVVGLAVLLMVGGATRLLRDPGSRRCQATT